MSLISELRRRNVHRVAIAYVAGAWLVLQVVETLMPAFGLEADALRVVLVLLAIGFVPALILSWKFEWTPEGLVREGDTPAFAPPASSKNFDRAITLVLVVAVAYFAADKFVFSAAPSGERSIAVLPLANISGDPDQDYFGSGVSLELTNLLASIPGLRVISSETIRTFANRDVDLLEAARKMDVTHIVAGAVRRAGNRVRVAVELFDAREDTQIWSQSYERELEDIFDIQDDIAARVVGELRLELSDEPPTSEQINPRAYELYLKGHHLSHTVRTQEAFVEAERLLTEAVELEPGYLPAIWSLARTIANQDIDDPSAKQAAEQRKRELVDRLVELAPDSSYANGWLGAFAWEEGHLQTALDYRARAIADADDTNVYLQMSIAARMLALLGRTDQAYALSKYVVRRDPACTPCVSTFALTLRQAGRHREAAAELEKLLEWRDPNPQLLWMLGVAWLVAGDPGKALHYFDQSSEGASNLGALMALHDLGRIDEFEAGFAELIENAGTDGSEAIARVAAWTGQNDLAFEYLDRMVEELGPGFVPNVKTDLYEPIKTDPRWQAFLERYGASDNEMAGLTFDPPLPPEVVDEIERLRAKRESNNDD